MIPFIPRSVTKKASKSSTLHTLPAQRRHILGAGSVKTFHAPVAPSSDTGNPEDNDPLAVVEEQWASLARLSMSEYTLWCDPELRHQVMTDGEGCEYVCLHLFEELSKTMMFCSCAPYPSYHAVALFLHLD